MGLRGGDSEIATYLFIRTDNRQPLTVNRKKQISHCVRNDGVCDVRNDGVCDVRNCDVRNDRVCDVRNDRVCDV